MTGHPATRSARARRKGAKREEKRRQIADSAVAALQTRGYANTSLRDIAAGSGLSLGMLHYYFDDKTALIIHCVTAYKHDFVARIEAAIAAAPDTDALYRGFAEALAASIAKDGGIHRLWYDIRVQAMFDAAFRPVVAEIEAALIDVVRRALLRLGLSADPVMTYAALDGLFRYHLQAHLTAAPADPALLAAIFEAALRRL